MDPLIAAALIGGGSNLLGGLMGNFFGGGGMSDTQKNDQRFMNDFAWKQALRNEQFQHDLARHGLKMRVDDATEAGLHPLVGAGINPAQGGWSGAAFTGVGSDRPQRDFSYLGEAGSHFSRAMGANINRAVDATRSPEERELQALQLENARANTARSQAERDMANLELERMRQNPPMPDPVSYSPTGAHAESMKYYGNQIFGPPSHPFWQSVGRNALRLLPDEKTLAPWRK